MDASNGHKPVLMHEVIDVLSPRPSETVLDCTVGLGGHAEAFLRGTRTGSLIALDADDDNLRLARIRLEPFLERITFHHANFSTLGALLLPAVDIVFADLGLSSLHLDIAERGFSFRLGGPLDMRLNRTEGPTASALIAALSPDQLRKIFREYGELDGAGKLAREIAGKQIATTDELRSEVERLFGFRAKAMLPQIFQALRIAVNDELGSLTELLRVAPMLLNDGGRLGIISFHSLEDRLVKHAFRELCTPPKDPVTGRALTEAQFQLLTKKAIEPTEEEVQKNPRSRSAKFRVICRKSVSVIR